MKTLRGGFKYDPERSKLVHFIQNMISWSIQRYFCALQEHQEVPTSYLTEDVIEETPYLDESEIDTKLEWVWILNKISSIQKERKIIKVYRKIIKLKWEGYNENEIAKKCKVSQTCIMNYMNNIRTYLRRKNASNSLLPSLS